MKIEVMDTTNYQFEKNKYDTIIVDPPYTSEENFKGNLGKRRWIVAKENYKQFLFNYSVGLIIDRIFQYAYNHKTWLIVFFNRPLLLSRYMIVWVKTKAGIGFNIGRNVEYVHLMNYQGIKLDTLKTERINEAEIIEYPKTRAAAKPVELYKKLFLALQSKKIFDPFAGWGNSVVAAKQLGLEIDALDKDESLQDRYEFLRNYPISHQSTLFSGVESET